MTISAPAGRAAAAARLREGLGDRPACAVEARLAEEDGETVLVHCLTVGFTISTALLASQLAGTAPAAAADLIHEALT